MVVKEGAGTAGDGVRKRRRRKRSRSGCGEFLRKRKTWRERKRRVMEREEGEEEEERWRNFYASFYANSTPILRQIYASNTVTHVARKPQFQLRSNHHYTKNF